MIKLKQINDIRVKPIKKQKDNLPIKGYDMFTEPYCNIFLCAKKKSGKSTVVFNILKNCVGKETMVHIFASTAYSDITYKRIMEMLDKKHIQYEVFNSLKEDGENIVRAIISDLNELAEQKIEDEEEQQEEEEIIDKHVKQPRCIDDDYFEVSTMKIPKEKKEPKKKYLEPEHIFIFDDLGNTLRDTSIDSLLKVNRHYKSKVIISSQYLNDLSPQSRLQLDYMLIFKGMPIDKLLQIHKDIDLALDIETFIKYYNIATEDKFNFLYIDIRNEQYRLNFDKLFIDNDDN